MGPEVFDLMEKHMTLAVAHTGFSYGAGTVSSSDPFPEKAPPLFLFSSNLRYIIFQNHILIAFCIPQKIFIKGRRSGPFSVRWRKMHDSLCRYSFCAAVSGQRHVHGDG